MVVTGEGLRIELLESDVGTFFENGSPVPTEQATEIIGRLAREVGDLPNKVSIEGHTDAKKFSGEYTNWELSSDRANTARRIMQAYGVRSDQVAQIRGFADQSLRKPDKADDPSNRRISIIIQHLSATMQLGAEPAKKQEHASAKHEEPKKSNGHERSISRMAFNSLRSGSIFSLGIPAGSGCSEKSAPCAAGRLAGAGAAATVNPFVRNPRCLRAPSMVNRFS